MYAFFVPSGGKDGRIPTIIVGAKGWDQYADVVCDGTDDQVEINNAIDSIVDKYGGGIVFLTPGIFTISSTIYVKDNVTLMGSGPGITVINTSSNTDVITVVGDNSSVRSLGIEGPGTFNKGIYLYQTSNNLVSDVAVDRASIHAYLTKNTIVKDSIVSRHSAHGILFASVNGGIIDNSVSTQNNQNGLQITLSQNISIKGVISVANGQYGIQSNAYYVSINGSVFSNNGNAGIDITGGYQSITGNTISNNPLGIFLDADNSMATGNMLYGNGTGIRISRTNATVSGNTITTSQQYAIEISYLAQNATIQGNMITYSSQASANTYSDIYVDAQNCTISNNTIIAGDTQSKYGIEETTDADYNVYVGNVIQGQASGHFNLYGPNDITVANILR